MRNSVQENAMWVTWRLHALLSERSSIKNVKVKAGMAKSDLNMEVTTQWMFLWKIDEIRHHVLSANRELSVNNEIFS